MTDNRCKIVYQNFKRYRLSPLRAFKRLYICMLALWSLFVLLRYINASVHVVSYMSQCPESYILSIVGIIKILTRSVHKCYNYAPSVLIYYVHLQAVKYCAWDAGFSFYGRRRINRSPMAPHNKCNRPHWVQQTLQSVQVIEKGKFQNFGTRFYSDYLSYPHVTCIIRCGKIPFNGQEDSRVI